MPKNCRIEQGQIVSVKLKALEAQNCPDEESGDVMVKVSFPNGSTCTIPVAAFLSGSPQESKGSIDMDSFYDDNSTQPTDEPK